MARKTAISEGRTTASRSLRGRSSTEEQSAIQAALTLRAELSLVCGDALPSSKGTVAQLKEYREVAWKAMNSYNHGDMHPLSSGA